MSTNEALYVGFNQEFNCICIATTEGYIIKGIKDLKIKSQKTHIEMLHTSNLLSLIPELDQSFDQDNSFENIEHDNVGRNGTKSNKVIIFDDLKEQAVSELSFWETVSWVKLSTNIIVVGLNTSIRVYSFTTPPKLLKTFSCGKISHRNIISFPSIEIGVVTIEKIMLENNILEPPENDFNPVEIKAHRSNIIYTLISSDYSRLATASIKGTVIRLFSLPLGTPLIELRRGLERAVILSVCFDYLSPPQFLGLISDRGTVHIFSILNNQVDENALDPSSIAIEEAELKVESTYVKSTLSSIFKDRWSFSSFKFPALLFPKNDILFNDSTPYVCGFDYINQSSIIDYKLIYRLSFNKDKPGPCVVISCTPLSE